MTEVIQCITALYLDLDEGLSRGLGDTPDLG